MFPNTHYIVLEDIYQLLLGSPNAERKIKKKEITPISDNEIKLTSHTAIRRECFKGLEFAHATKIILYINFLEFILINL